MAIHIGKKIKEEVYKQRISITIFAKKISRSRNVVYDIFERESVDTALLNKIGKVLSRDFFSLYSAQKEYSQDGMKTFHFAESEGQYQKVSEQITQLQQENQALKSEVDYLKKIVVLMEGKKTSKKSQKK